MSGATMKAVEVKDGKGPVGNLFINAETPKPVPGAGEVLVKAKAFGLNRMDLMQREGVYPMLPHYPKRLGVEFSGVIESIGPSAEHTCKGRTGETFTPGDEVLGLAYGGAYAEYISASASMLMHKPASLSWEEAAGIPETFITATQALHVIGEFAPGKSVLWHAGASGVSIAGIQLSRDAGASKIFATAGTDEKCRFVEGAEVGATKAFNYKTDDWEKGILEATDGKGVDIIIDFVGASYFQHNLAVAAKDAHWVVVGMMGGTKLPEGTDIGPIAWKRLRIEGSTLRSRDLEYQGRLRDTLAGYLPDFEKDGGKEKLRVKVDAVFEMEDIQKAHELMAANKSMGKIICTVP
ncbi:zinc-binding alcohol dehydrogenase domain-containing protein 2 [Xylariaceae sp. FL0255]|nr:zinc-binding alcohol dehydrogenase domain-containing protein 2 [Xylariaceae sp. FL0255]